MGYQCKTCIPLGSPTLCSSTAQCCTPNLCNTGAGSTNYKKCLSCLPENGKDCTDAGDCCLIPGKTVTCLSSTCGSCSGTLQSCTSQADCCTPNLCNLGVGSTNYKKCLACLPDGGMTCTSNSQCCTGLVCQSGTCSPSSPPPPSICSTTNFNEVVTLSALGAIATAALIALTYMFGKMFQNARALTWAKTEALQIFVSIIVVIAIIEVIGAFCSLQIDEIGSIFTSLPPIYNGHESASIYDAAKIYLENMMWAAHYNMDAIRYSLGAYEIRTSFVKMNCEGDCFINMSGYDEAIFGGETLKLALTNNMLSIATISYLTAAFQYFTLLYILNGLFLVFLPIAIVIRSIPFMRQLGGALVGIFLALYFFYPLMLVFDSVITTGIAANTVTFRDTLTESGNAVCGGKDVFGTSVACEKTDYPEKNLDRNTGQVALARMPEPVPLTEQIRTSSLIFISTVFLAAFNFIVIAAIGRGITRFLGEEADISKLGQMI